MPHNAQSSIPHRRRPRPWALMRALGLCTLLAAAGTAGCSGKKSSPNGPGGGPTPLSVSGITPGAGATNVNVGTAVTASFSRDIDATTVTNSSFYITGVAGTVSAAGNNATFTPSSALAEGTMYSVVITADVQDMNAVGLASQYTSSFTTGVVANANAGPDRDASLGETVALTGTSSAPGTPAFDWDQVSGPSVGALSGSTAVFTAPDTVSTLIFTLRVDNGSGWSAPDTVVVWVLEDRANAYWVSPSGSDDSAGTRTSPLLTVLAALDKAAAELKGADVYIASGNYSGSVTLAANVSLYGGYDPVTWLRDVATHATSIHGGPVAIYGDAAHNVVLDGLNIYAADATQAGESSIGVSFTGSQNVTIARNLIAAGNGAAGNNGVQPGQPLKRAAGGTGDGAGDCIPANAGGSGAGASGRRGGNGGAGGAAGGFNGGGGEGPCGDGGGGGFAAAGGNGANGCSGATGDSSVAPGLEFGAIVDGAYITANGTPGSKGVDGGGGGGGGGGAGSLFGCGAGGGGGGEGGLGGSGGTGGQGGGASLGIVLSNNTSATIVDNVITTANGGAGGYGGNGGTGGIGGDGGSGGGSNIAGWSGGGGGNGGAGAPGGRGASGGGGPSVGVAEQGSTSFQDRLTFQLGTPGVGGVRPDGRGTPGYDGELAEVKKLP